MLESEITTETIAPKLTENLDEVFQMIDSSSIPDELKTHFCDIAIILGRGVDRRSPAKQILVISDELNNAKRLYCKNYGLQEMPEANEVIYKICDQLIKRAIKTECEK